MLQGEDVRICAIGVGAEDVALLRSLLVLKHRNWAWVDDSASAQWWVIDADQQVRRDLVARSVGKTVLAIGSDFSRLPSPQWTFVAKPLRLNLVMNVLEHLAGLHKGDGGSTWCTSELSLERWPNITRYNLPPPLIHWCGIMLQRYVPYLQLVAIAPPVKVNELLSDAHEGQYLKVRKLQAAVQRLPPEDHTGTWRRFWSRWSTNEHR